MGVQIWSSPNIFEHFRKSFVATSNLYTTHLDGEVAHTLGHAAEEAVPHLGGQGVDPLGPGRLQAQAEEEEGAEGHNFHIFLVLGRCRVSDGTTNSDKGTLSPEMKMYCGDCDK